MIGDPLLGPDDDDATAAPERRPGPPAEAGPDADTADAADTDPTPVDTDPTPVDTAERGNMPGGHAPADTAERGVASGGERASGDAAERSAVEPTGAEVHAEPEPTRIVPAPVLPPGGLTLGASAPPPQAAPPPDEPDPLWAATMARHVPAEPTITARAPVPPSPPPPGYVPSSAAGATLAGLASAVYGSGSTSGEPGATTAMPQVTGELGATTAMPRPGDDLTATRAMPGVARAPGQNDTAVMPAVAAPPPGAENAPGFEKTMRRHRRRWWRRGFKAVLALIFLGIVYVGVNFALVLRTANTDQARPVDVIVVLGAAQYNGTPSPQLQARLDHTVDLWNEGLAGSVFVTGGKQPGDAHTEAEASRDYLVERGVPGDVIQMEDTAHSTWESLSNFAEVADRAGWQRVLLVTDPFHSLRSRLIAQELGFTAYTSPTQTSPVQGREELMKEVKESLGISLGRIIGFERLWKLTG